MKKRIGLLAAFALVLCVWIPTGCGAKRYTVTYETQGGTVAAPSRQVSHGDKFVLDVPERDDASFLGWFAGTDEDSARVTDRYGKSISAYAFENDITVYAKWEYWDTEGLAYSLSSSGDGYIVFAPEGFSGGTVKIPARHNGLPVVRVGEYAFFESATLHKVILPDTLTSIGACAFDTCTELETVENTSQIERVEERAFYKCAALTKFAFGENVNFIGVEAFANCSLLSSVDFSASAQTVTMKQSAFSGCAALSELTLPRRMSFLPVSAFASCGSLQQVRLEGTVRQISDGAFSGCANLRSLHIGACVNSLGADVFGGCTYLREITVDESNASFSATDNVLYSKDGKILYRYAPYKENTSYTAPSSVTHIAAGAFADAEYLTDLRLNGTVALIDAGAFSNMQHLTDLTLPFIGGSALANNWFSYVFGGAYSDMSTNVPYTLKNVTILSGSLVAERAFQFCNSLSSVNLPDTLTAIGAYAFYGCASLTELTLPSSVRAIGEYAFVACTRLRAIAFDGDNAFFAAENGLLYNKDKTVLLLYPAGKSDATLTLPSTVAEIADNAFYNATRLRAVTFPDGLLMIGNNAFYNCRALETAELPSSVKTLGSQAFAACSKLHFVRLSENLQSVGSQAFYDCAALATVKITAAAPPAIGNALFLQANEDFAIELASDAALAAYGASDWAEYRAHFVTAGE